MLKVNNLAGFGAGAGDSGPTEITFIEGALREFTYFDSQAPYTVTFAAFFPGVTLQEGDVVFIVIGTDLGVSWSADRPQSNGGDEYEVVDEYNSSVDGAAYYRVMGATPDTSITLYEVGNTAAEYACVMWALRGVNTANVLDSVEQDTGSGTGSDAPDVANITLNYPDSLVFAYCVIDDIESSTQEPPTGFTMLGTEVTDSGSVCTTMVAYFGPTGVTGLVGIDNFEADVSSQPWVSVAFNVRFEGDE